MSTALSSMAKGRSWPTVLTAFLLALGTIGTAEAEKVGVAAAVNPDAFSSLSGAPQNQLNIGKSIFYNERINTTASGLVQVLLVDGSTFTVGPGSDLVIDRFVYDPRKKTGEIAVSFSKGAMRFVGGKISKNEGGVTVKTPAGALAIRGGMFQAKVSGTKGIFSFLYGVEMKLTGSNGQVNRVYQPGYTIDTTGGGATVRPTTAQDTNTLMQALTNSNTGTGTGTDGGTENPGTQQALAETISLQDLIADATATQIDDELKQQELNQSTEPTTTTTTTDTTPPDTTPPDTNPDNTPPDNNPPHNTPPDTNPPDNTPPDTNPPDNNPPPDNPPPDNPPPDNPPPDNPPPDNPPPPTEVNARVLTTPGTYTAFPGTGASFSTDDAFSVLGGDPDATVDDFELTLQFSGDRLIGTASGLTDSVCIDGDCETTDISPATINLPQTFDLGVCENGVCLVADATVTQDHGVTTYTGLAVLKQGFFAYQLINEPTENQINSLPEPILLFGGTKHDFATPSGKIYVFGLTPDVLQNAIGPFASAGSSPDVSSSNASITPLMLLETDSNEQSRAVWLQSTFYIGTAGYEGDQQDSFINIALGEWNEQTGMTGARRGGSHVDFFYGGSGCDGPCINQGDYSYSEGYSTRESFSFTGDIASLSGPDGSHFLGTENPNVIIGADSTGSHNIFRDTPLDPQSLSVEDQSGGTYHVGVALGFLDEQAQTHSGEYKGYAAGLVQSEVPASDFHNVVASTSPDDMTITFSPESNTLSSNITVRDVQGGDNATSAYNLGFGFDPYGEGSDGYSAYINNLNYAAIERPNFSSVMDGKTKYQQTNAAAYLISGDQIDVTSYFPETFEESSPNSGHRPLCSNCDEFIKWGAWGARVEFGSNSNPDEYVDNIHLGWWAAGDLASAGSPEADLDKLAASGASATYNGHVIGNVAAYSSGDWNTYVAAGNLDMDWYFAQRSGTLTISDFDANGPKGPLNVSGTMTAPGYIDAYHANRFSGGLNGTLGNQDISISGNAAGSFVRGPLSPAQGVVGNWNVGNSHYKAGGIFAGSGTPLPQQAH